MDYRQLRMDILEELERMESAKTFIEVNMDKLFDIVDDLQDECNKKDIKIEKLEKNVEDLEGDIEELEKYRAEMEELTSDRPHTDDGD